MEDGEHNIEQTIADTTKGSKTPGEHVKEKQSQDEQCTEEKPTEEQLEKWRKNFDAIADENGFITSEGLEICLQKDNKNPTPSNIEELMSVIDTDGDGKFGFDEYVKIQQQASKMTFFCSDIQMELEQALKAFDENDDGTISKSELKTILTDYDDATLDDVIKHADTNGDGQLSITELAAYLTQTCK